MATIQIITHNNENTIENLFKSIISLEFKIYVADLGSIDKTIQICKDYKAEVKDFRYIKDYSKIRNSLIQKGLNIYLEPWETLVVGHEIINSINSNKRIQIIEDKVITKQLRIWTDKSKFVNPAYETIVDKKAQVIDVIVLSLGGKRPHTKEIVEKWAKERPTNPDPCYYQAFDKLESKQYNEYENLVQQFLFKGADEISTTMTKYYLAYLKLYYFKQYKESIKYLLECIALHPTMAEFWCLLGDNYYQIKDYKKAKSFYENAIILGKKRLKYDFLPMDIPKYKEYPSKMIQSCEDILNNSRFL